MATKNRYWSVAVFCTTLAIAVAIGMLSCSVPTDDQPKESTENEVELGGAEIEWGAGDGLLLVVMEDDVIGSAAYYGTANPDGSDMILTGMDADTGEDYFYVTLDDEERPTQVAIGSMTVEYSYNPDGSFNFEITYDGDVVYSDVDLSLAKSFPQGQTAKITRDHIVACVAKILETTTSAALIHRGVLYTGPKKDHPLYGCLQKDEMVLKLAQISCIVTLVMNARISQIEQEKCSEYQLNPEMQQYCRKFVAKQRAATYKLAVAIHKTILAIAVKLYDNPECNTSSGSGGVTNNASVSSCDASGSLLVNYGAPQWDEWGCACTFNLSVPAGQEVVFALHYLTPAHGADYWKVLGTVPATGIDLTQTDLDTREAAAIYQRAECAWLYQVDDFNPKAVGLKVVPIENKCKKTQ